MEHNIKSCSRDSYSCNLSQSGERGGNEFPKEMI